MINECFLTDTRNAGFKIKNALLKLNDLKYKANSVGCYSMGDKVQVSKSYDAMADKVVAYVDFENKLVDFINDYIERYRLIINMCKQLSFESEAFIIDYYLVGNTYPQIAAKEKISEATVYRTKKATIQEILELNY